MFFRVRSAIFALSSLSLGLSLGLASNRSEADSVRTRHATVELVSPIESVTTTASSLQLGIRLIADPGWHTYWLQPGDTGLPTQVEWKALPEGTRTSPLEFPAPEQFNLGPLINFGFEGEVLIGAPVRLEGSRRVGEILGFEAEVRFLICKESCVPERAQLKLALPVTEGTEVASKDRARFERLKSSLPKALTKADFRLEEGAEEFRLYFLSKSTLARARPAQLQFFPVPRNLYRFGARPRVLPDGGLVFEKSTRIEDSTPFHVVAVDPKSKKSWELKAERARTQVTAEVPPVGNLQRFVLLLQMIAWAFLGGLLLNAMPCVFPVLSLKALSILQSKGKSFAAPFLMGVMTTFLTLATVLIAVRSAGEQLGWGFQLQSPGFVAFLVALFVLIGLNLMGVFEVVVTSLSLRRSLNPIPSSVQHFFDGVVAVVVASPCTAPFMATALGFALAEPQPIPFLIFGALGIGFALPLILIVKVPAILNRLPKPGAWMVVLKEVLSIPIFASAVWLMWVFALQTGADGLIRLVAALFALAGSAFVFGAYIQAGRAKKGFRLHSWAVVILSALVALTWGYQASLLQPPTGAGAREEQYVDGYGLKWEVFSEEKLRELRKRGKPVFVDFTAAWCITCQVNEKLVFSSPEVIAALKEREVILVRADWTSSDPEITKALQRYQRSGVPLYILFSSDEAAPYRILPQLLTPSVFLGELSRI